MPLCDQINRAGEDAQKPPAVLIPQQPFLAKAAISTRIKFPLTFGLRAGITRRMPVRK
jgi:hypothetical protein